MTGEYLDRLLLKRVRDVCTTRRAVRYRLRTADDDHEQFVGANQGNRGSRCCCRADRPVP